MDSAPIFLAAPTSPEKRLQAIAAASQGFVYAISRTGITGKQKAARRRMRRSWSRNYASITDLPIAVGFGISNAEHVTALGQFADAAVVGSAIVATIEESPAGEEPAAVARFIKGLRRVTRCRPVKPLYSHGIGAVIINSSR